VGRKRLTSSDGTGQAGADFGKALLSQNAGWTMAEFSRPLEGEGEDFTNLDFEEALDKVSEPERKPEKA
jgi:hypothetical protein